MCAHCNGSLFPIACLTCWSHVLPLICESAWTVDQRWAVIKNRRRCASINQIPTLCSFITRICLFFGGFSNIPNEWFFSLGSWKCTPQIDVSPTLRYLKTRRVFKESPTFPTVAWINFVLVNRLFWYTNGYITS